MWLLSNAKITFSQGGATDLQTESIWLQDYSFSDNTIAPKFYEVKETFSGATLVQINPGGGAVIFGMGRGSSPISFGFYVFNGLTFWGMKFFLSKDIVYIFGLEKMMKCSLMLFTQTPGENIQDNNCM